jgi:hypothetical protein
MGWMNERPWLDSRHIPWNFILSKMSRPALGLNHPPIQWVPQTSSEKIKCSGCEPSLPYMAKVKIEWCYTSTPYTFLVHTGTAIPLIFT